MTLSVLYFDEPLTLRAQLQNWAEWPAVLRTKFELLVVDDTSRPHNAASRVLADFGAAQGASSHPPQAEGGAWGGGATSSGGDRGVGNDRPNLSAIPAVRILRVHPPKRYWNIGGGRNLAMHTARGCWVIICDLDYGLSIPLAEMVLYAASTAPSNAVFKFTRTHKAKPMHPALMMLRREIYWQGGGCDEDFVGHCMRSPVAHPHTRSARFACAE